MAIFFLFNMHTALGKKALLNKNYKKKKKKKRNFKNPNNNISFKKV